MNTIKVSQHKERERDFDYRIRRKYGNESIEACMLQVIKMVVAQNLRKEHDVV